MRSVSGKQKALVTGGAGFIGSHLCELLLADGCEVWALDDLSTGGIDNVQHLRERADFHLVVDSVLAPSVVSELVYKCDVVYHLAAAVGVRLIVEQPVHTMVTNVQGTETVLEYCNRFGKRVLVASSFAWIAIAAAALRKPRLVLLAPAIVLLDLTYRITMLHALVKTIAQPTIATCKWDSPTRFDLDDARRST